MNAGTGTPTRNKKLDRNTPQSREKNKGADRRRSRVGPPKGTPPPNQANATIAGISPQELAVGEKIPPGGHMGGPPQVGPTCEAASPLRYALLEASRALGTSG